MGPQAGRTDLALEIREGFTEEERALEGIRVKEAYHKKQKLRVTTVTVMDEQGARVMGKPIGTYITIEAPKLTDSEEERRRAVAVEIEKELKSLLGQYEEKEICVIGLGNREFIADALGPMVVDDLFVTRHLVKEMGKAFQKKYRLTSFCAVATGVMAQTGMESGEIVKGIVRECKPDILIAIDALAARSMERVTTTVQITDTGICPGAGIGNNRQALNEETLGIPVIALGVPTVVDAATIVREQMEKYLHQKGYTESEQQQFLEDISNVELDNLFVTPKGIDEAMHRMSETVAEAVNACFCKSLI